jgi:hypothetical protein
MQSLVNLDTASLLEITDLREDIRTINASGGDDTPP